jgi:hypothetical protein
LFEGNTVEEAVEFMYKPAKESDQAKAEGETSEAENPVKTETPTEVKPETKAETSTEVKPEEPQPEVKNGLKDRLRQVSSAVKEKLKSIPVKEKPGAHKNFAEELAGYKDSSGKELLTKEEIKNILFLEDSIDLDTGKPIENFRAKVLAVLDNPEEVAQLATWAVKGSGIWHAIRNPLTSTFGANPEIFGVKPEDVDFVKELAKYKDSKGKSLLSPQDIRDLLNPGNQKHVDGTPIEDFRKKVLAVLNNPEEIAKLSSNSESKASGIWLAVADMKSETMPEEVKTEQKTKQPADYEPPKTEFKKYSTE